MQAYNCCVHSTQPHMSQLLKHTTSPVTPEILQHLHYFQSLIPSLSLSVACQSGYDTPKPCAIITTLKLHQKAAGMRLIHLLNTLAEGSQSMHGKWITHTAHHNP